MISPLSLKATKSLFLASLQLSTSFANLPPPNNQVNTDTGVNQTVIENYPSDGAKKLKQLFNQGTSILQNPEYEKEQKFQQVFFETARLEGMKDLNESIVFSHHGDEAFMTNTWGITDFTFSNFLVAKFQTQNPQASLSQVEDYHNMVQNKIKNNSYRQEELRKTSLEIIKELFWQNQEFQDYQPAVAFMCFQLNYNSPAIFQDVMNEIAKTIPEIYQKLGKQNLSPAEIETFIKTFAELQKEFYGKYSPPSMVLGLQYRAENSAKEATEMIN